MEDVAQAVDAPKMVGFRPPLFLSFKVFGFDFIGNAPRILFRWGRVDSHFFSRLGMKKLKSSGMESDRWFASLTAWNSPRMRTAILPVPQNGISPTRKL
jgi:hypothetical protein